MNIQKVRLLVDNEKIRQKHLHGDVDNDDFVLLAVLSQKVGEVARAVLENAMANAKKLSPNLLEELIEVIAVSEAWLEKHGEPDPTADPDL